ncbi:right-handed parallel beta-helix repeat-containing protein [Patescibacteria group bacterium]|nr:right-handed parallel beta-helix repeat-containing protein [Patescibacteria group bacterium]
MKLKPGIKKEKLILGSAAVFLFSLAATLNVQAAEYNLYVDDSNTTGTEDGTSDHPYNTITEALNAAQAGNTIFINNGTYSENIEVPREVELYGENRSNVVIDGGNGDDQGITVKLNHKTKLKKLTIQGGYTGVKVPEKAGVTLNKVTIKDAKNDGVILEGSGATRKNDKYEREFKDCDIEDNGARGMHIYKSRVVIDDSEVTDNEEEGVDLRKGVKATIKGSTIKGNDEGNIEFKIDKVSLKIKNNKISNAGSSGLAAQSYQGIGGKIFITDNKIKNNKKYGLRCAVEHKKPRGGGWGSKIFLSGNSFSSNKKGNISPVCGF